MVEALLEKSVNARHVLMQVKGVTVGFDSNKTRLPEWKPTMTPLISKS